MDEDVADTTLYVRGMDMAAEDIEDVWDDSVLNSAYDKALKLANEQVAKRIAMDTNSKKKGDGKLKLGKVKKKPDQTAPQKDSEWKPGMPCRAIYNDDGLEYEAFLVKIIDDKDCIVKFLGYGNSERVPISSLQETHGDEARMQQVEAALGERADDGIGSQTSSEDIERTSHVDSPEPAVRPSNKNKKANKKKKNQRQESEFGGLPQIDMSNLSKFINNMNMDMPMMMPPPPPQPIASSRIDAEEQTLSDMLLSWYMTGYYTGLYQGMKRQRQSRRYN